MSFFKGIKEGFHDFGNGITKIINFILLFLVYFIGVALTSIIAKLFKKHFLNLNKETSKKSYWKDYNLKKEPIDNYYRQF